MTRVRSRFDPHDKAVARYHYVSFDVGPRAAAVSVHLRLHPPSAVVDLGVFDPNGFRGYSGGARDRFVITRDEATPGYLPGPLAAGEWSVLLGLHSIPAEGASVELTISTAPARPAPLPPAPPPPSGPPGRGLPSSRGRKWVACDLHAHSVHSDGALAPAALAARARARGLDVVAVTDHNTVSHHAGLPVAARPYGVELVPGQEVTVEEGHLNCFGDIGWIDFRKSPERWVATARERGGITSVNHPTVPGQEWRLGPCEAPLIEAWHGSWDGLSGDALELWRRSGATAVGGSDFHRAGEGRELGCPTTWLEVEDGTGPLDALRAGRVSLSCDPHGPVIVPRDDEVEVLDAGGTVLIDPDGRRRTISSERELVAGGPGPYRLVAPDDRTLAITCR